MARQSDVAALMGGNPNQVHAVAVTELRTALADRVPSVVLDVATNKPATYWRVGNEYFLDHPDYPVTNIKDFRCQRPPTKADGMSHEDPYNAESPDDVLFDEIERTHGTPEMQRLRDLHNAAKLRRSRVANLKRIRSVVETSDREVAMGRNPIKKKKALDRDRRILANPQAYVDGDFAQFDD